MDNIFMSIFFAILCFALINLTFADDGGFGSQYNWYKLDEGLEIAESESKPLMVVIHKSWCGACKALKPQFAASLELEKLSEHFVMVNAGDDDEPKDKAFAVDGTYVPRIFFLDSKGKVQEDLYNEQGNPSYKFFYFNADGIVATMRKAVAQLSTPSSDNQEEL